MMQWKRTESGKYTCSHNGQCLAQITPIAEPGKRTVCWELEKVVNARKGLGSHGIVTKYEPERLGVFPTLKQAKAEYQNIAPNRNQ